MLIAALLMTCGPARADEPLRFTHENVLGTTMTLRVATADAAVGRAAERAALAEIERLGKVLSRYDAQSELSRFNASAGAFRASQDLIAVAQLCRLWRARSGGAFDAGVGPLIALWKQAERDGKLPSAPAREAVVRRLKQPRVRVDHAARTLERLDGATLLPDGLAKGYIIDKALDAARRAAPGVGLALDIGGDLGFRGAPTGAERWTVDVADPRRPADNAPPLARLALKDAAVATSGGYARYFTVAGRRYSHVLDPRRGWPVSGTLSATVVANDARTADALATALYVLGADAGVALADRLGAACLIVDADGEQHVSKRWKLYGVAAVAQRAANAWPDGRVLTIEVELPRLRVRRYRRPYVAIWIEDGSRQPVRTLAVWGDERKWLGDLRSWWRLARDDAALVRSVTRATRRPGRYTLEWDGTGDGGALLPRGTYTVHVEAAREHGGREHLRQVIRCDGAAASANVAGRDELSSVVLRYGPRSTK